MMEKILIFKTASDNVVHQLLKELDNGNTRMDCLIQSSLLERYTKEYQNINFINIQQEGFYNVSDELLKIVSLTCYDKIYIPLTGIAGYNFGNIVKLVTELSFKQAFFYNCNGEMTEIPMYNRFCNWLCRSYIRFATGTYGRKGE